MILNLVPIIFDIGECKLLFEVVVEFLKSNLKNLIELFTVSLSPEVVLAVLCNNSWCISLIIPSRVCCSMRSHYVEIAAIY